MIDQTTRETVRNTARPLALRWCGALLLVAGLAAGIGARAQGILTVTPAGTIGITAGTGTPGYSAASGPATSAALAAPSAVTYDTAGNLYIADTRNHVVRKIAAGNISTVAGVGTSGFSGDGGAATSAQLDTPTGVAVDGSGNIYIADSRNNRVRLVNVSTGNISTYAGTGVAGFSGDGGAPASATLAQPSGVALSADGTKLYIADTNNQRIRMVSGGVISTVAGNGVQGFSGDSGTATAANLDSPVSIALDSSGNLYIADRHNQRVRKVAGTTITTLAGSNGSFAGAFAGDGSAAASASLAHPSGVFVDAGGNVYIADTNNQRIRKISGTTIATSAGNGVQGAPASGSAPTASALNAPAGVSVDASGNTLIADKLNQYVETASLALLTYSTQIIGTVSAGQTVTLSNTGTASISVSAPTYTGPFATTSGGTCAAFPVTITSGSNCTVLVSYVPTAVGTQTGTVTFSGTNVVSTSIRLSGTGVAVTPTKVVFTSAPPASIAAGGNAGTVSVALEDAAGNIATTNSTTQVMLTVTSTSGYSQTYMVPVTNGVASFNLSSVSLTAAGSYTYTASASGLTSAAASETVTPGAAVSLTITGIGTFTAPQMSGTATVRAFDSFGNIATGFTGTVVLSSSDATATFSPNSYSYVAGDAGVHSFTVTFNTAGTQTLTATAGSLTVTQINILVEDAIWVVNADSTLVRVTDAGVPTTNAGTSGTTSTFGAVAFDNPGNVWTVSNGGNVVREFSKAGVSVPVAGNSAAGVNTPTALAVDGAGQIWVANGNATLSVLSNAGAAISPSTGYQGGSMSSPSGIIVDNAGSVWITNRNNNSVTKVFGAAAPVVTPIVTGTTNNTLGTQP